MTPHRALGLLPALLLLGAGADGPARIDYALHCQGCHLADGSGKPGAVPDLRASLPRLLRSPGGRAYLIRVPGSALSTLDDAALARVLDWMLHEFAPASPSAPFTAAEVALHRAHPLADVAPTRRSLLDPARVPER